MGRVIFIMARPICVLRSLSLSPAIRSGLMGGLAFMGHKTKRFVCWSGK